MPLPEIALWRAVIVRALVDAFGTDVFSKRHGAPESARRWLTVAGPEYRRVCEYAGIDPDALKDVVKIKMEEEKKNDRH